MDTQARNFGKCLKHYARSHMFPQKSAIWRPHPFNPQKKDNNFYCFSIVLEQWLTNTLFKIENRFYCLPIVLQQWDTNSPIPYIWTAVLFYKAFDKHKMTLISVLNRSVKYKTWLKVSQ